MPRRRHASPVGALVAMVLLLEGCATSGGPDATPATPSAPTRAAAPVKTAKPAAPAPVVDLKPATITGSEETSTLFDNFTAYIAMIDGQAIGERNGWSRPLALKPGLRGLKVAFVRGVFFAHADVQINARADASYMLKFATDAHVFGKNTYCEFWIEDTATGEKVLAPTRVPLSKVEPGK